MNFQWFRLNKLILWIPSLLYLNSQQLKGQDSSAIFGFETPKDTALLSRLDLWATYYCIHQLNSKGYLPFKDIKGEGLGLFADTCDFCKAALEGTAFVKDSAGKIWVLNYDATGTESLIDCRLCANFRNSKLDVTRWGKVQWKVSEGFGDGVQNYKLVPYRTIAVDEKVVAIGSVIYIPAARGVKVLLPDSSAVVHDGYFFAADKGGAIKENHIDVFSGTFEGNPFVDFIFSNPKNKFEAYLVEDKTIIQQLTTLHKNR